MKLVVAETHERFRFWCSEHGVSPHQQQREARYISRERDLRGIPGEGCEIVFVHGWKRGKSGAEAYDIKCLVEMMATRGATVISSM